MSVVTEVNNLEGKILSLDVSMSMCAANFLVSWPEAPGPEGPRLRLARVGIGSGMYICTVQYEVH